MSQVLRFPRYTAGYKKLDTTFPDGFAERTPAWHFEKFVEFTALKMQVREPSPHLAMVGHMSQGLPTEEVVWRLGCYAATYCLPTAQVIWSNWDARHVRKDPVTFLKWLTKHWPGIVTRTERRCVRSVAKMNRCLTEYAQWTKTGFPRLLEGNPKNTPEYYEVVWESVGKVYSMGRYIAIRLIEGLRRFCDIPASLRDIRSIGGWSPKKCLVYLYPQHYQFLLSDTKEANRKVDALAERFLLRVQERLPKVDHYIIAAMLCEYRGAFENRHQYVGWTIDQEPLLYDKVREYWGKELDTKLFLSTRKALFPRVTLGEHGGWNGTRWPLTKVLRDFGYNWTDNLYDYVRTEKSGDWKTPIRWKNESKHSG